MNGHWCRVYAIKDETGTVIPNTFAIACEAGSDHDFTDIVVMIENVQIADALVVHNLDAFDVQTNTLRPGNEH